MFTPEHLSQFIIEVYLFCSFSSSTCRCVSMTEKIESLLTRRIFMCVFFSQWLYLGNWIVTRETRHKRENSITLAFNIDSWSNLQMMMSWYAWEIKNIFMLNILSSHVKAVSVKSARDGNFFYLKVSNFQFLSFKLFKWMKK